MSRAKLISIGQLKGGSGKSSLTNLLAKWIVQNRAKKVLVIDCDDDSQTIALWRQIDESIEENLEESYELITNVYSADFVEAYGNVMYDYDIIFVDFPGNLKQEGVKQAYTFVDMLIMPINEEEEVIVDANALNDFIVNVTTDLRAKVGQKPTEVYGVINNADQTLRKYKAWYEIKDDTVNFPILENIIPYSKAAFGQKSTVKMNTSATHYRSHHLNFCSEAYDLIKDLKVQDYE